VKYYYREHIAGYERVQAEGKTAWHEIHDGRGFDDFPSRAFLQAALPRLSFSATNPSALEIGCGTGVGACFLAERGFQVDGIDLIPTAIEIAVKVAAKRGLDIHYQVQDICELAPEGARYDMVVDSYCLQGIVLDEDRARVFSNVRARLEPEGYYLVSTAVFDENRLREETVFDQASGIVYKRYGENGIIDPETGVVYVELEEDPHEYEDAVSIQGTWYLPNRRHLRPSALRAELEQARFRMLDQDGGNVVCVHADSAAGLRAIQA
jgi:SAM-dependent methyltransferase